MRRFIQQLKFKTASNEFEQMIRIAIGCYDFRFEKPLTKAQMYNAACFLEVIPIDTENGILHFAIWLIQNQIPFKLKFQYNKTLNPYENWILHKRPKLIQKAIHENMDIVMHTKLPELDEIQDFWKEPDKT